MKDILATGVKILGLIFAALVIGFTTYLTWLLAQRIIPNNTILQFMTLALFDGGALVWFLTFITQAKGTMQWAISGVGFLVGLAGAVIMAAGELILGQQLVKVDDPTKIGWILILTVIVAAIAHATMIYAFHFSDPGTKNRIENAQKVAQAIERAYSDARAEIDRGVDGMVAGLVDSVLYEAQRQVDQATAIHIRNAGRLEARAGETMRGAPVVDGKVKDAGQPVRAAPTYTPAPQGTNKRPFGWFGWRKKATPPAAAAPTQAAGGFDAGKWNELVDMMINLKSRMDAQGIIDGKPTQQAQVYASDTPAVKGTEPTSPLPPKDGTK